MHRHHSPDSNGNGKAVEPIPPGRWSREDEDKEWSLLDTRIGFPIGVAASMLTVDADWIGYCSRQGFNVLTYKTVRSIRWPAHKPPNLVILRRLTEPLPIGRLPNYVEGDPGEWLGDPQAFSTANSFGVPSSDPEVWQSDVAASAQRLRTNQLLIVSVMGSYEVYEGNDLIRDFVRVARLAESAGAKAIELNLSCPNTLDPTNDTVRDVLVCDSPSDTERIVKSVRHGLDPATKLVVKLSYLPRSRLELLLRPIASEIDAVSGINTLQLEVRRRDGSPTFVGTRSDHAKPRHKAGVSGVAIREYGLDFVRSVAAINETLDHELEIIGMGGARNGEDVKTFFKAGANAVQTGSELHLANLSLPSRTAGYARA
jgi:dihydroorotate dehydrogenase